MHYGNLKFDMTGNVISDMEECLKISETYAAFDCCPTKSGSMMVKVTPDFISTDWRLEAVYVEFCGDGIASIMGVDREGAIVARRNFNTAAYDGNEIYKNFIAMLDNFGVYSKGILRLIEAKEEPTIDNDDDNSDGLLSMEALDWLNSINYSSFNHEDRLKLIAAAKIAYPG